MSIFYISNSKINQDEYTSNVHVFPISFKRASNPGARTLSEANLTPIFRSFTDTDAYVISDSFSSSADFEFMIHGYYCKIESSVIPECFKEYRGDIFAFITVNVSDNYPILVGKDSGADFTGVCFTNIRGDIPSSTAEYKVYSLRILNSDREVPRDSKFKFNFSSINLEEINLEEMDGGIV